MSKPGYAFKDLGKVIEDVARHRGFSVNKTYGGHGINQLFHTRPNISHYEGNKCPGTMKAGMTFTIEPMICVGNQQEMHWPDNVSKHRGVLGADELMADFVDWCGWRSGLRRRVTARRVPSLRRRWW